MILVPLVLILLSTVSAYLPVAEHIKSIMEFLGEPFLALTIATLLAIYFLGIRRGFSKKRIKEILEHSLRPVGMILLVIASGGVIRWMLQDSGLGNVIGPLLENSDMPLILIAFLVCAHGAGIGGQFYCGNNHGFRNYGFHAGGYGREYGVPGSHVLCHLRRRNGIKPCQ